jgi:hypothetical protein
MPPAGSAHRVDRALSSAQAKTARPEQASEVTGKTRDHGVLDRRTTVPQEGRGYAGQISSEHGQRACVEIDAHHTAT